MHPVSPDINKVLDYAGIEDQGKNYEEQELDMSNMQKILLWIEQYQV